MKTSIGNLSLVLLVGFGLASLTSPRAHGQTPDYGQSSSGTGPSTGNASPVVGCTQQPCTSAPTGRKHATPPPGPRALTPAELEGMRYSRLFSEIAAQERMAQQEQDAGHSEAAASWHGYFAAKSGLTPQEAEKVKKIGAKYIQEAQALQAKRIEAIRAARHADPGVRVSRFNSPEIAAVEKEIDDLLPNTKAELITALGSKSFTRLDSYTIHSHESAITLSPRQTPLATVQQGQTPETSGVK